jgi:hypothetical protein
VPHVQPISSWNKALKSENINIIKYTRRKQSEKEKKKYGRKNKSHAHTKKTQV